MLARGDTHLLALTGHELREARDGAGHQRAHRLLTSVSDPVRSLYAPSRRARSQSHDRDVDRRRQQRAPLMARGRDDLRLRSQSHYLPASLPEMKNISGVSQKKLDRYGVDFLRIVEEHIAATGATQKIDIEQMLSEEQLALYIEEMKQKKVRLSHFALGKILLGSERNGMNEEDIALSFYGVLKNITKYNAIRPRLADYFEKNIYKEITQQLDNFFFPPVYNHFSETARKTLHDSINNIPIEKPTEALTNQNIVELRKTYPRSHEPWKNKEVNLFHETVQQTNDIDFLSLVFQRSPNSIKAAYEQMIKKSAELNS